MSQLNISYTRKTMNSSTFVPIPQKKSKFEQEFFKFKIICHRSRITCNMSPVICHLSFVTCHLTPVICHLSFVTCHLSQVTCHLSPTDPPPANSPTKPSKYWSQLFKVNPTASNEQDLTIIFFSWQSILFCQPFIEQ